MSLSHQSQRRLRLPLLLLGALLLNVLAIASLTLHALRGERAELAKTRQSAQEGALALLASQTEQALQAAVQTPFLLLKNLRQDDITPALVARLHEQFGNVDEVIILDRELKLRRAFPSGRSHHKRLADEWIVERAQQERKRVEHEPFALHTFVEALDGHPTLFAFQALSEQAGPGATTEPESWILLRFRLEQLIDDEVTPLLADYKAETATSALLLAPNDPAPKGAVLADINEVLPGWQIATGRPSLAATDVAAPLHELALFAVAGGAILAVALTIIAAWWEMRREHALIDLRNRFVANVSHELKTPLSLIRMYAETLFLQRQRDPVRQHEYLQIILRESERLSLMINDVLNFTLIRNDSEVYQLTATQLSRTVAGVIDQYRMHFERRGLPLHATLADDLPPVPHDPNGITQILLNLLDNAAKYAHEGELAEISLTRNGDHIDLAVTDYGRGLPADKRARLQHALAHGDMLEDAMGSGLGLALVVRIARVHEAYFQLDDADGHTGVRAVVSFRDKART